MAKNAASSFSFSSRSQQHLRYRSHIAAALLFALVVSLPFSRKWMREKGATNRLQNSEIRQTMEQTVKYVKVPSGRGNVKRYAAQNSTTEEPISIQSWMTMVSSNSDVGIQAASDLSSTISTSPYASVLFETPGSSWQSSGEDHFEFALVDEPALHRFTEISPDRYSFAEHFSACLQRRKDDAVCSFVNLGGDASLVSPLPQTNVDDISYSHLAAFVRHAPESQVTEFWRLSALTYLKVSQQKHRGDPNAKTWFSTNGMGVSW
eukprot:CAMPEP_0172317260 /NCGR_PEP_ID=MMETSP1058-20130122/31063_1 /TAXON_ID=83371 /ORGANISM="Detonula confervacea, Strain CCMP 353" /LENGTH=262 /DNA_ID=CAMNT_0013031775 /DNA_START=39 /DNA_END=824 /DNA_ORIENTATION=+